MFSLPTPKGNMPNVLSAKTLGLPRWAWIAILAGGLTIGLVIRRAQNQNAEEEGVTEDGEVVPEGYDDQFGYLPEESLYDGATTMGPSADGGYFEWPEEPNAVEPETPAAVSEPYYETNNYFDRMAPKKSGSRSPGKKGAKGDKGATGNKGKGKAPPKKGGKGKTKKAKKHGARQARNSSLTGGGPPTRRAVHQPPRHRNAGGGRRQPARRR